MAKILLVEDEPVLRDMLTRRLKKRGYEVTVAEDGPAALVAVGVDPPDLILMDIYLEGSAFDGLEATRRIKNSDGTRTVPIIALTAYATAADREKAIQAGCDDHETKPIDLPQLLSKVEGLLKKDAGHER
jgi:CheY-like chemotaxis protein